MALSVDDMSDFLHLCVLAVHRTNGEIFKILMLRHMKWVKYLICHEILVPLVRVIFFKQETYSKGNTRFNHVGELW